MTPEETLDWLAQQHFDQCREERPIQDWIRKMKSQLPAQPEQEPVAWTEQCFYDDGTPNPCSALKWAGRNEQNDFPIGTKFYTAPPQRKPLTDEQYEAIVEDLAEWSRYVEADTAHQTLEKHVRQVLAAHGIKEQQ